MAQGLWIRFPKLLLEKVNGLLDHAPANSLKSFQLFKLCQSENVWLGTWPEFQEKLDIYYRSIPRSERKKSHLDYWLHRPLPNQGFSEFSISFRTAAVEDTDTRKIAEWAHHTCRTSGQKTGSLFSLHTFHETIRTLIQPRSYLDVFDFDLEDFYSAFKKTTLNMFGEKVQSQVQLFIGELKFLDIKNKNEEKKLLQKPTLAEQQAYLAEWKKATVWNLQNFAEVSKPAETWIENEQQRVFLFKVIDLYNLSLDQRQTALQSKQIDIQLTLKKLIAA